MAGNERVRYCPECKLNVYNFSSITTDEAQRIISQHEGRLCARFYQRTDGTLLVQNCPVGFRVAIKRVSRMAGAALTAVMSVGAAMAGAQPRRSDPSLLQIQAARPVLTLEVVDPTGAVIPKAQITIVNEKTKIEIRSASDATGRLSLSDLPPGSYEITVVVPGFATLKREHIDIPAREALRLQVELAAFMGEVIEVRTEPHSSPISGSLIAPSQSTQPAKSNQHPNFLRRFSSALGRIF
jgi:hypothetical protein